MGFAFRKITLLVGDVALLYASLWLALFIGFWGRVDLALFLAHAAAFTFLYVVWIVVFYVMDLYDLSLPPTSTSFMTRYGIAIMVLFGTGVLFFYATTLTTLSPKTNLLIHVLLFGLLAYLWRLLFSAKISPLVPWRIGLLDLQDQDGELKDVIQSLKHHGYESTMLASHGQDLAQQIQHHALNVVILPVSFLNEGDHIQTLYACLGTGVTFLDLAQAYELFARRIPLSTIDHEWFIRNVQEREHGLYQRLKRGFDLSAATLILLLTLPVWLLVALAIKLEGGDVFYVQERVGKNRQPFLIKKFRTMRTDAEAAGAQWATRDDARVTRVGKMLRASHLDELPQMLNVLKGELSLVGPRPERPVFVTTLEQEIPHYRVRHFVKPGFTGWAQIKFRYARSVTDSRRKFEYDLYYVKNRSLILDFLILLKTVQLLFRREQ
ncbi:exopolysaccharide biosynthesis polyprenyl glycosylphosphotransferase [Candidatus Uhrbacteria bacterium]|nr:exopolysaccharide biosynthesis polyprenyl glycosylphosphotransferase [Candidatus Uhrbacteria bacterium]